MPWSSSKEAYTREYPANSEAVLRLTIDPNKCRDSGMKAEMEMEGQRIVWPIEAMDGNVRPLYFALLDPKLEPVSVDFAPSHCVVQRAWGPLGDGTIPPLQFFDPNLVLKDRTLAKQLWNVFVSFL